MRLPPQLQNLSLPVGGAPQGRVEAAKALLCAAA